MEEEWKFWKKNKPKYGKYAGYEYYISNLGRVKINGEIKTDFKTNGNMKYIKLGHTFLHTVVATLFVPNPNNYPTVDHIDRNPNNNRADNLRWVSWHDQAINRDNTHQRGFKWSEESKRRAVLASSKRKQVIQIDLNNNIINKFISMREVERKLGYAHIKISACCRGLIETYKGYKWKYEI